MVREIYRKTIGSGLQVTERGGVLGYGLNRRFRENVTYLRDLGHKMADNNVVKTG